MEALRFAMMVVGFALAALLLWWLRVTWLEIQQELERQVGWHRMWTERIMDATDERYGPDGPP